MMASTAGLTTACKWVSAIMCGAPLGVTRLLLLEQILKLIWQLPQETV